MSTVFLLSLLIGFSASLAPSTLRLINLVYRHGDRSPATSYPRNPNRVSTTWPSGLNELTPLGIKQLYATGAFLRRRYSGFLSDIYKENEIRVESSDRDRCLMSAYSNLAGLYPPKGDQIWNPKILWQPIPVHTRPADEDNKLNLGQSQCPRFFQLYAERLRSPEVMKEAAQNKDFVALVYRESGLSLSLGNMGPVLVFDTLYCEQQHNITFAPWVTPAIFKRLESFMWRTLELKNHGKEQGRLLGGPLLKEFVDNMQSKVNGSLDTRSRMFMYSGHGETVAALLSASGIEEISIPYAGTVMMELHEENGQYNVQIFYRNFTTTDVNSTREPTPMTIPGCTLKCPFDKFMTLIKYGIPDDWKAACALKSSATTLSTILPTTKRPVNVSQPFG